MMFVNNNGRVYRPVFKNNMLDVVATVAYGQGTKRGQFMLSIYVRSCLKGAGTRGATEIQTFDIPYMREYMPGTTTQEEQAERLTFMCNVIATRCDTDYALRLPMSTRPQVSAKTREKYEREARRNVEFLNQIGKITWHTKT